jgi:carbamate kinase
VILTQVPAVYAGFGTSEQRPLEELQPDRDEAILADLAAGSMRPKVEAAFKFVRATGGEALITSASALEKDEAGTRIVPTST